LTLVKAFKGQIKWSQLRAEAFSHFWLTVCTLISSRKGDPVVAYRLTYILAAPPAGSANANERKGPSETVPDLLANAQGDVLEIGPGSGTFLQYLDRDKVQGYYAAEPTVQLHAALRSSAEAMGFEEQKFEIFACGGEPDSLLPALSKAGMDPTVKGGTFDTIISIRTLCSLSNPHSSIQAHYDLLRPGGRFLAFEHVQNPWPKPSGSLVGKALQSVYHLMGWPYFLGDCHLNRDTVRVLQEVAKADGGWAVEEVTMQGAWTPMPWVTGVFVKKGVE
jgi:SAM-dependent methyltransferase